MSEVDNKVKMIVEGLLLASGKPLTLDAIAQVFKKSERPDRKELKAVMEVISEDCNDRGFELKEVSSGVRFQVKQELSEWVAALWDEKPPRYTRALLETLALIAYRQPITRGDIEEIRGVGVSSSIIRTLLDREWVRVVGHRDVPGRPAMFATTRQFLDYFNLKNLQDLPPLAEIKELDQSEQEVNLEDDLAQQRVLDVPEEFVDEASFELSEEEAAEMLAEEEAIELSKKPLDEILSQDPARQDADAEEDTDLENDVSEPQKDSASEPDREHQPAESTEKPAVSENLPADDEDLPPVEEENQEDEDSDDDMDEEDDMESDDSDSKAFEYAVDDDDELER